MNIPDDAIETVGFSKALAKIRGFKTTKIVTDQTQMADRGLFETSSSEVLNQLLLSFFKLTGQKLAQNVSLNVIEKFPILKSPIYSFPFD